MELLEVDGHGHVGEGDNLGGVRANASRGGGVAKKIGVGGTDFRLLTATA